MTEPRFIDANKIDFKLNFLSDADGDVYLAASDVRRVIAQTPTEDVVPKSKIASDIFKEIERIVDAKIISIEGMLAHNTASKEDVAQKKAFEEILDELAELEKKYVSPDCRKCRRFVGCEKAIWTGPCDVYSEVKP